MLWWGKHPPLYSPPFFSRLEFGWEFRFSQYREPLSSPVRRCTGFCYQLIRVEASGSRDQAVALIRRPLPSRAGLHPGRRRDGEPRYPLVC